MKTVLQCKNGKRRQGKIVYHIQGKDCKDKANESAKQMEEDSILTVFGRHFH